MSQKNTQSQVVEIFETIKDFLKINGVKKLIYKTIPQVYHKTPSQEDLYAIFCLNGTLIDRKVSSAIYQRNNPGINNSRKKGVKRAVNHGITLEENIPLDSFWNILSENLNSRFDVNPVHTLPEIISLQQKFPDNIIWA